MRIKYCNPIPVGKKRRYTADWSSIRHQALLVSPLCQHCGRLGEEVHHKDWNKHNNCADNLVVLCKECHLIEWKKGMS